MKIYFKRGFNFILWLILLIVGLALLIFIVLQIPAVQRYSKEKVVAYLEGKIKTKVSINKVQIGFSKDVILEGVYFEDQKKDTLFAGKKLVLNINLYELLSNKVEINSVELESIVANVYRNSKSEFNFDYIIKAFQSQKKKDNSLPMEFFIDKIKLDNIKINYVDDFSKNDLKLTLDHLDTRVKTFNLNQMNFEVPKLKIDGLQLLYKQEVVQNVINEKSDKSKSPVLKLKLGIVDLSRIKVEYFDENLKLMSKIDFKKLLIKINLFDLSNNLLNVESIKLSEANGNLNFGKIINQKDKKNLTSDSNNWKIKFNEVAFDKVNFNYNDNSSITIKKGIDYNHLQVQNLNLDAEKIDYNSQAISGKINSMRLDEKSGLKVESIRTIFYYGQRFAYLKNLYLKTPQTILQNQIIVAYPSVEYISKNLGELIINANLNNSRIGFKDILTFVPTLSKTNPFRDNPNAILFLNTTVLGKLGNLTIPNLQLSGIGSTKINANGTIIGLPDINKAYFNLNIKNLESTAKDIYNFLPINTIPNTIQLPTLFSTKGTFKGNLNNFKTDLNLKSSLGNGIVKGVLDNRIKNREKYNFEVSLDNFDLGRLLKNDSIGKITLTTNINGTGFNPKTANAIINAAISKANFNSYTYQNLDVNGKINNGSFTAIANIKDPNLKFNLVSSGDFKDEYPKGKIHLNVDIADLYKLNLYTKQIKIRGIVDADIQSADIDYLNGNMSIHHLIIANEKEQFATDSINVVAVSTSDKNLILLNSPFMDAEFIGKYKLSTVVSSVKNSFSKYFNFKINSKSAAYNKQQLTFNVKIKSAPILLKLVPDLKSLEPISINGRYNSENDSIIVNGSIPNLVYGSNSISNAIFKIHKKDNTLLYSMSVAQIKNASIEIPNTTLIGQVADNVVDYVLLMKDIKNKDRYQIAGNLLSKNSSVEISIDPKNLFLNYENWVVSNSNKIRFDSNEIYVDNFELSRNGSSITLQSETQDSNPPLAVNFKNFKIQTISNFVKLKNYEIDGTINGNANFKNLMTKMLFTANLNVDSFAFRKEIVGNIKIKVNNDIADTYTTNIEITGQDNQVNLDGNYSSANDNLNMNLDIQKLNLKSIQVFSIDNITDGTGFLNGKFKILGNTSNPKLNGELKFNEIGFKAKKLNANFKSMNDKLVFGDNAILFDDFTIKDEKDNDLTINGKIDNQDYANLGFDLTIDADNFKAVNSKAKDNEIFYGELFLDNHLIVKGSMNSPMIEGNIKINKGTKFTIVLPQDDPSIADRDGIVEFIDRDQPKLFTTFLVYDTLSKTEIKGINASVNIEIDKDAEISIIIDKSNGDFLKLNGEAQLTGGIDPSGKTTLTGRYELENGSYEMNFNLIKRKFDIKKGSYLLWTGEPTKADINITAVYKIATAPIDLLINQLSTLTSQERNTYKQKIPFETELKMKGELLKPNITFDIILPEGNNSVSSVIITNTEAKLAQLRQDPDEMNKQVFALLLLGRFIGEDPFSSESGRTTASSLARESASKILSQQLNNLASDLIKGFEVDFNLASSEDFTTGEKANKTDLNVGLSKKLLNDRLKVTIGSSFGIEGPEQKNKDANTFAGDISLEYQLSKDGRYKIRAYRKNLYQVALQGQVIESGIGFVITMDYNKFEELFHSKKVTVLPKKAKKKSDD